MPINDRVVLITGGTGSFGKQFVDIAFRDINVVLKNKIIIDAKNIFGRMDLPEGVKIYTLGKSEHKIEAHG